MILGLGLEIHGQKLKKNMLRPILLMELLIRDIQHKNIPTIFIVKSVFSLVVTYSLSILE